MAAWRVPTVKVEADWSSAGHLESSLPPVKTEDGDVTDHEMGSWSETSERVVSSSLGGADTITSWQVNNSIICTIILYWYGQLVGHQP